MASLSINFIQLGSLSDSLAAASTTAGNWIDANAGASTSVSTVATKRSFLASCRECIKRRNDSLQEHADALSAMKASADTICTDARAADSRVAQHVRELSEDFYRACGMATGAAYFFESLGREALGAVKAVLSVHDAIMQFYDENKYLINLIVDVVVFAFAIVVLCIPGLNGLALFFALWGLLQSYRDLARSLQAYQCYLRGDEAGAASWAERNLLREGFEQYGPAGGAVYDTISLAATVFSVKSGVKNGITVFGDLTRSASNSTKLAYGAKIVVSKAVGVGRQNKFLHSHSMIKRYNSMKSGVSGFREVSSLREAQTIANFEAKLTTTTRVIKIGHGYMSEGPEGALKNTYFFGTASSISEKLHR
jgi:hypothetical protein